MAYRPAPAGAPLLLFAATLAAGLLLGRVYSLPWPGLDDAAAAAVGYGFGLAGTALLAWGSITLASARAALRLEPERQALIAEGPFQFRRNPLAMGAILLLLGLAQATHEIWLAVLAPIFALGVLLLSILPNERRLEASFGQAYVDYKERTRRWF
jgi:protein-S-isoprenylcysteine O-methyltransferase Ste14